MPVSPFSTPLPSFVRSTRAQTQPHPHEPAHESVRIATALGRFACAALLALVVTPAQAIVVVSGPDDGSAFLPLDMPTGQFDERGLSGFEYLISSVPTGFSASDQYLIQGEDTNPTQAIGADLGTVDDLSGAQFNFSIQHNLAGGRNFTFALENAISSETSVLCWGQNCDANAISAETINGFGPLDDFNGIQVQVRAQEVFGSSVTVTIDALDGVTLSGEPLFSETVIPTSPGTIISFDRGRRGQWFIGEDNDLIENEWNLRGTVTLNRPDDALSERTKVRLAVDLVRNPNFPSVIPEPSTALLVGLGLLGLARRAR